MAMRDIYLSRRYLRPIVVGLFLCSLSGFALGQALGHHPSAPQIAPRVVHASGALGTATPTRPPITTVAYKSPPALSVPVAPHHKDKGKHSHGGHDTQDGGQRGDHGGQSGHGGKNGQGGD